MTISASDVKALRDKTNAGMMDCKEALTAAKGDFEKAEEYLRKKGLAAATKRSSRTAKDGSVTAYIHMQGKIGVLVEVNCETDFVAKTDAFKTMTKDIAMHIAAMNPRYLKPEDIPGDVIEREKEIYKSQLLAEGKPEKIIDKISEGKLNKFYEDVCLMKQKFVKDPALTIEDLVKNMIATTGENMIVRRFVRFLLGEEI
ncbi:MAG: translation elongation factor Ts [Deltaproteobacteria bacterium]|nr:translation elongation factor Ts [Deltaproteobacteria bacterium]